MMVLLRPYKKAIFLITATALVVFISSIVYLLEKTDLHKWLIITSPRQQLLGFFGNKNIEVSSTCQPSWIGIDAEHLTVQQINEYLRWGNTTSCGLCHDFGGVISGARVRGIDGQKAVCIDPPSVAPKSRNCTVYSFGINNEWSFDDAMERYGCQVYAFDPSMAEVEDRFDRSHAIHFYKLGLGVRDESILKEGETSGWRMRTLSTIYQLLGHEAQEKVIDYLKIDIEGSEWEVLSQIMESGMLANVRQIAVEIHFLDGEEMTLMKLRKLAGILRSLEDRYGMVRFDSKMNPWSKNVAKGLGVLNYFCYEIAWYNSLFLSS